MNLGEARICERRAPLVGAPDRRRVRSLSVGREVEDVPVTSGREDHRFRVMRFDGAGDEISRHDTPCLTVDYDEIEHLGSRKHLDPAGSYLLLECLIGAKQKLLAGLPAGVKGSRHLRTAEGSVRKQSAVPARKWDPLCYALIDDVDTQLREPVDIGFARAKVAALDGVVEKPVNAVAVVPIILGGVDTA